MNFSDLVSAAAHGAASVYHDVVDASTAVHTWATDPAIAPYVKVGVNVANAMLTRVGVVNPAVIEADIAIALKALAALDATLPSRKSG